MPPAPSETGSACSDGQSQYALRFHLRIWKGPSGRHPFLPSLKVLHTRQYGTPFHSPLGPGHQGAPFQYPSTGQQRAPFQYPWRETPASCFPVPLARDITELPSSTLSAAHHGTPLQYPQRAELLCQGGGRCARQLLPTNLIEANY
jgi:hypothetical protein